MSMKKKRVDTGQLTDSSEARLIQRSRAGDQLAFDELAGLYSRRLYNLGLKMLGNSDDAADMAQDTLLKVYRSLAYFRGDAAFSTWVYRIAANTCRDMLRSAYRRHEMNFSELEDEDGKTEFVVADYSAFPEQILEERDTDAYLNQLIMGLKPKYRLVLALRELHGLSYQEIADAVHLDIGTVKSRLNRARAAMRQQFLADAEHYPELRRLMGEQRSGKDEL